YARISEPKHTSNEDCKMHGGEPRTIQKHRTLNCEIRNPQLQMDDVPNILIPRQALMDEVPTVSVGSRRNEDIALDLMKFVAMTTGYGRTSSTGVGFQGGGADKPEEYAAHLLEVHGRLLAPVRGKDAITLQRDVLNW